MWGDKHGSTLLMCGTWGGRVCTAEQSAWVEHHLDTLHEPGLCAVDFAANIGLFDESHSVLAR